MRNLFKFFAISSTITFLLIFLACNAELNPTEKIPTINVESIKKCEETATATEISAPIETTPYYQLQIEFITDSDWSTLEILNTNNIYTIQFENKIGNISGFTVNSRYLNLNQEIEAAKNNNKVGLNVDYLVSLEIIDEPIKFILYKGFINNSYINIYYIDGTSKQLIQKIENIGIVKNDQTHKNPKEFTLDVSGLKNVIPKQAVIEQKTAVSKKMVWAFYYPWYDLNEWSNNSLKDKPIILYESNDSDVISNHIIQAKNAGIDGFISSWSGPDSYTDNNLKIILDIAKGKEFSIAVLFETLSENGPIGKDKILQWLKYIITNYGNHPAYAKVNGKPLIVLYQTRTIPLYTWRNILEQLRNEGYDATFLGMEYSIDNLEVFDGIYEYSVFWMQNYLETFKAISQAVRYYHEFEDSNTKKIFAATVQPGYDDRLIPGREGNFKDREEGVFYRKLFEAAIASDPDFIFITSWNEWLENTHIEPSELYGNEYLDITREYAKVWKEK